MNETKYMNPERVEKLKSVKVGIIEDGTSNEMEIGLKRLGIGNVINIGDRQTFENIDVVICPETDIEVMKETYEKAESQKIPAVFLFNFGIGGCVTVTKPGFVKPSFIYELNGKTPVEWMLKYTRGFNEFWNVQYYPWLESVEGWINSPEIKSSIGYYTTMSATLHVLAALMTGEEIKYYPKFYLNSMKYQP